MGQTEFLKSEFSSHLDRAGLRLPPISIDTLQINITRLCNQVCVHCHVDASPKRREMMSDEVVDQCLSVLAKENSIKNLDITGGAPELHPRFKDLVQKAKHLGKNVIVRHNLTVTMDPHPLTKASMAYLPDFYLEQKVEIISSLPYYQEYFTDRQRGQGIFKKSIASLHLLNAKGFGVSGSGLILNLVYNPVGPYLPGPQLQLETDYKRELKEKFNIEFNHLYAVTNMPIHRFKAQLVSLGGYEAYMEKLKNAFNPQAAEGIMCRNLISVSFDGTLYDCDFNQMLNMSIGGKRSLTIFDFHRQQLLERDVVFADHCFGCTAGAGSSCGGTTA